MSPSTKYQSKAVGCVRCGRPIVFVRNVLAQVETFIPVEPVPDGEGNVWAVRDDRGRLSGWPVSAQHPPRPPGRLYMPHPAICPVQPGPVGAEPRRDDPQLPLQFDDPDAYDEAGEFDTEREEMRQENAR